MQKLLMIAILCILFANKVLAEDEVITNNIRGIIIDKQTQQPLVGASVKIFSLKIGVATDKKGEFELKGVGVGRYTIVASYISYKPMSTNIVLSSGKSPYLKFELEQSYNETEKVVVTANKNSFTPLNENVPLTNSAVTSVTTHVPLLSFHCFTELVVPTSLDSL